MTDFTKKDLRLILQKWRQEIWDKKQIPLAIICGGKNDSLSLIASLNFPKEDLIQILKQMLDDLESDSVTKTVS